MHATNKSVAILRSKVVDAVFAIRYFVKRKTTYSAILKTALFILLYLHSEIGYKVTVSAR